MPKKRKYPKQPKRNASIATWERYEQKCKEVKKYNDELAKAPAKKQAIAERVRKMK